MHFHKFHDSMILSYGRGLGLAHILNYGDVFSHVPDPQYTDFQQNNLVESFRNDFCHFCVKVSYRIWVLGLSWGSVFSFHKVLLNTHIISHIFCVRWRQNLRSTFAMFYEHGFSIQFSKGIKHSNNIWIEDAQIWMYPLPDIRTPPS